MIKYNNNTINDWFYSTDNIIKVYRNNAICYYKIDSSSPSGQTPCFAVVEDISQYSDTEFEDVFNKANGKWYKLNNLNEYEEYGVYGSGRTITTYEGKLTIDTESTPQPSRLPAGYTEVEYIRQNSNYDAYINTGVILFDNTSNTYTVTTKLASEFHSNLGCATIISCERVNSPYDGLGYRYKCSSTVDQLEFFGGKPNYNSSVVDNGDGTRTVTFQSTGNSSFTTDVPLSYMAAFSSTTYGANASWRHSDSTIYSATVVKNGVTVRDFVPAKRDSDDKYGLYDLITETFYTSPNDNNFSGGSEVIPPPITATCEFIYSGGSWVNVGEVSGSTIQTVWFDPPSSGDNARFDIGHYWGENYKMIWTVYLQGSYSSDVGSFWGYNNKSPIELSFYSNGYYYDMHNPTSTSSPSVETRDYSYRILKTGAFSSYENSQVMNLTFTYGSLKAELEDGTPIFTTGSTRTGFNWYDGLYEPYIFLNSGHKCHVSRVQVYNANDVLVNDLKFVKNNTTGSQEISMYDSVLNVTYNNTNSNTPTYHVVEEGGGIEYPVYYDEIQDPPNNLSFSSMTEAEAYECPWVGMHATIDGDKYVFSGDSVSGYEWVYNPSRLPIGYTEVEYVQNTGTSYFNTNFVPNQDTRVVADMQMVTSTNYPRLWGAGAWNSANGLVINYEGGYLQMSWLGNTSWTRYTSVQQSFDRKVYDVNKNYLYVDSVQIGSNTYTTRTASDPIGVFTYIGSGRPSSSSYWGQEHFKGKMYSFQIYDNGTLVRDLVPCIKDSDNTVGAYDIVNDVFYTVPTGYTTDKLVAGDPV